jgi:putative transposase
MARKGKSTEEIIGFLREAEVRIAQGQTAGKICRGAGISEQTYYKWRARSSRSRSVERARLLGNRARRSVDRRKFAPLCPTLRTWFTHARLREGLSIFPTGLPSGSACPK